MTKRIGNYNDSMDGLSHLSYLVGQSKRLAEFQATLEALHSSLKSRAESDPAKVAELVPVIDAVHIMSCLCTSQAQALASWTVGIMERDDATNARLKSLVQEIEQLKARDEIEPPGGP